MSAPITHEALMAEHCAAMARDRAAAAERAAVTEATVARKRAWAGMAECRRAGLPWVWEDVQ